MNREAITIYGITRTIEQWATHFSVEPTVLEERLDSWPFTLRLEPAIKDYSKKKHEHEGESLTINGWADRYGMSANTLQQRLTRGWSIERALTQKLQRSTTTKYKHDGETLTLTQLAKKKGIHLATLSARLKRGMPLSEALLPVVHTWDSL